jgi:hypothetical protein
MLHRPVEVATHSGRLAFGDIPLPMIVFGLTSHTKKKAGNKK